MCGTCKYCTPEANVIYQLYLHKLYLTNPHLLAGICTNADLQGPRLCPSSDYCLLEPERGRLSLPWGDLRHSLGRGDFELCLKDGLRPFRKWSRKGFLGRGTHDFLENSGWCFEQDGRRKEEKFLVASCMKSSGETKNMKAFFLSLDSRPSFVTCLTTGGIRVCGPWSRRVGEEGESTYRGSAECLGVLLPPFSPCSCWASFLCSRLPILAQWAPPFLTCSHLWFHLSPLLPQRGGGRAAWWSKVPGLFCTIAHSPVNHGSWQMMGKFECWRKIAVLVTKAWRVTLIPRLNRSRCNPLFLTVLQVIRR